MCLLRFHLLCGWVEWLNKFKHLRYSFEILSIAVYIVTENIDLRIKTHGS